MQTIYTPLAPMPIGPYSQAIRSGDFIFLSGQIALNPVSAELVEDDIGLQTRQICENIKGVLEASGLTLADIVKTTIYLTNMADFPRVNEMYGEYFSHKPARSTVGVASLPKGAKIEIESIAQTH